ncbi:MAG: DUF1961 family protein [Planctomycetes bacterium]|nr:DUF1961 family protein [Planctomycetota bacterium]MBL7043755.1 DUF1961 family protein [Pirellulaceae bacterium]
MVTNLRYAVLVAWIAVPCLAIAEQRTVRIEQPIQPRGTIALKLRTKQAFENGSATEPATTPFLSIPNLGEGFVRQDNSSVRIGWQWKGIKGAPYVVPQLPELPGPDTYFIQFTWDAEKGLFDFYVNGHSMRKAGVESEPWTFAAAAEEIVAAGGPVDVGDLIVLPKYLPPDEARRQVPKELLGRHAEVFGGERDVQPLAIDERRGRLLYEAKLVDEQDVRDWVLEGPGEISFEDGWMKMRSTRPDAKGPLNGHIVHWCPRDFPERFVAEWEIQLLEDMGLTIVFFAAKGENGEDIFDPNLPERDGTFVHYIRRSVKSYHISYYASTPNYVGRPTSNLRKNNRFYLLSSGQVAIPAASKDIHHIRLIKDGAHIQLQCDGKVSIDFTDPGGERHGPVYGGGKIGHRQMQWTVGRYRNFRVWELRPDE